MYSVTNCLCLFHCLFSYLHNLTVRSIICFLSVRRTFVRIWIKFSVSFSELLIRISLIRVTTDISTSYTRSNSRNSSLIQTNLLLTNGCEKPKQSRKKRGHLFKSQSKTFLYFVHTLKVFLFWHRGHVSVFLDSFEKDADL